jgi:hypothetical protein
MDEKQIIMFYFNQQRILKSCGFSVEITNDGFGVRNAEGEGLSCCLTLEELRVYTKGVVDALKNTPPKA